VITLQYGLLKKSFFSDRIELAYSATQRFTILKNLTTETSITETCTKRIPRILTAS